MFFFRSKAKKKHPHIRINLFRVQRKSAITKHMEKLYFNFVNKKEYIINQLYRKHLTDEQKKNVESVLVHGSYQQWFCSVHEKDIIWYLYQKDISRCHPVLINAISMYPFRRKRDILFVCRKFQELLLYSQDYHESEIIIPIAGFFEAAGFTPAVPQLIWRRNYFLTKGFAESDSIIVILNSAIESLLGKKAR